MKFYFARHGEGEHNARNIAGPKDAQLTSKGIAQAEALAEQLRHSNNLFDYILTSNLQRAQKTAGIVADMLSIEVVPMALLNEVGYGTFATQPYEEYLNASDSDRLSAGAESNESIKARTIQFMQALKDNEDKPLIVGHENFTRHILLNFDKRYASTDDWRNVQSIAPAKLFEFNLQ